MHRDIFIEVDTCGPKGSWKIASELKCLGKKEATCGSGGGGNKRKEAENECTRD